ncbi:MAG: PKD domain-containing protein, partial [Bacteroidales bacterium]|nr:PKD domain-containing protein [Bacteroidales bacterium]
MKKGLLIIVTLLGTLFMLNKESNACTHTISLYDSYGDGWHSNNFVTVRVNGTAVLTNITLASGSGPSHHTFNANAGDAIQVTYTSGSWANECYYDITDGGGLYIVNDYYPNTSGTFNGSGACPVVCPTCPAYSYGIFSPTSTWQTNSQSFTNSECRIYAFSVVAGLEYYFKTGCGDGATASFDTYLELYDGSCNLVASNDDGCESLRSSIAYTPTNSGTYYLRVRGFGGAGGSYTLAYSRSLLPGENCTNAQDLASLTSPYSATTSNYENDFTFCSMGSSNDRIFYCDLPAGYSIEMWQSWNNYDSRHTMRYGGACPGTTEIGCIDDSDYTPISWTNTTGSTQRVYWINAGFSSGSGDFTLNWTISIPEMIVPTTGNNSYTVCSGNLYDAGGSTGNYNNNWDGYTVLYPDVSGNNIQVAGTTLGENCCDYLYIYNGVGTAGTLLWSGIANSGAIPSITSTDATGALTIRFDSDGSITGAGFDLSINCVPPPITYTCSGTFTDSGGASGNYGDNENQIWTFCPDVAGHSISMDFTFFEMEIGIDELAVYDGTSTSDPNIGAYHGALPLLGTVNATPSNPSGCLTFRFTSDATDNYGGWEADISCAFPCQSIEVDTYSTNPTYTNVGGINYVDVCQGEQISFSATGLYAENGTYYAQSDATSTFTWYFGDGTTAIGNPANHTYSSGGAYDVSVVITDNNNCFSSNAIPLRVRMSTTPDFSGTSINPSSLCVGEELTLSGSHTMTYTEAPPGGVISHTTELPDGTGVSYYTTNFITLFAPGQTVTSINDIISVEANMEHSYLGDIDILLQCPNGQSVLLNQQTGSNEQILGEPIATDLPIDSSNPAGQGNGYDYMWSPTSTNGYMTDPANWTTISPYTDPLGNVSPSVDQVIPQDYQAFGNWSNLIGCPLNGLWKIRITDYYANDNGYIFSWGINFDPSLISTWGFTPTLASESWTGNNVTISSNPGTAFPNTDGSLSYTYNMTDNFGCLYTENQTATVNPLPTASASNTGPYCVGDDIELNSSGGDSYNWSGPSSFSSSAQNPVRVNSDLTMAGNYSVTVTNSFSCTASLSTNVIVNPIPSILTTTPDERCGTGTLDLAATADLGTINWYNVSSGGFSQGAGNSFTTGSISTTTTYYADATASGCTSSSRTPVIATIYDSPSWGATTPSNGDQICILDGVYLEASVNDGDPASSITWRRKLNSGAIWTNGLANLSTDYPIAEIYDYQPIYNSTITGCALASPSALTVEVYDNGDWIGSVSNDWHNVANWCGAIPGPGSSVTIPATATNDPVISAGTANVCDITINPGANLELSNDQVLNVYCDFTNNGTFVGGLSNEQVNIYGTPSNLLSGNDIFNNLTVTPGASLEINDDLFIRKNFTNNGSFDHNHHEISFIGNIPQQINSGSGTFGDITINNTAGTSADIILIDDLTITDHLTLNNGIVNTNSNSIIFTSSAGSATGNSGSFVNGRITRTGSTPFVFPTGNINNRDLDGDAINEDYVIWAPIGIEPSANATVSVEYAFDNTSMPDWWEHGGNMDATLHHVSDREYWIVDSDQELTTVTLYWNDNAHALGDICPHGFDIGNPADFVPTDMSVAYWSGSMWTDVDYNSGSSVINHDQGYLTSRFAVPFGTKAPKYITFGSKNNLNPLPVDLISFDAECQDYQIEFNWTTASETNNDYFVIEMSKDMINFE